MAQSPLSLYKKVAEEFGIKDEHNTSNVGKLAFAREQVNQMQHVINRLLFDIVATKSRQEKAQDPDTKTAFEQLVSNYTKDLRQTRDAVDVALRLVADLEAEVGEEA